MQTQIREYQHTCGNLLRINSDRSCEIRFVWCARIVTAISRGEAASILWKSRKQVALHTRGA